MPYAPSLPFLTFRRNLPLMMLSRTTLPRLPRLLFLPPSEKITFPEKDVRTRRARTGNGAEDLSRVGVHSEEVMRRAGDEMLHAMFEAVRGDDVGEAALLANFSQEPLHAALSEIVEDSLQVEASVSCSSLLASSSELLDDVADGAL